MTGIMKLRELHQILQFRIDSSEISNWRREACGESRGYMFVGYMEGSTAKSWKNQLFSL